MAQGFRGALEFDVVVCLGPADGAGDDKQIPSTHSLRKGNFAIEIINSCLAAHGAIAGQIVVGGKHSAHAGDFQAVIGENLQRLVDFVAEIGAVVVAVQLDVGNLGLLEPRCRVGQRLSSESPVAPGEFEARLAADQEIFLSARKRCWILLLVSSKCC